MAQATPTPEEARIVDALTDLVRPFVNARNPGCCPFTFAGLQQMWRTDPDRYAEVAEYHGWPTSFADPDPRSRDGKPFCKGLVVSFTNHAALRAHARAFARKAPPLTPPPTNPSPVEYDEEDDEKNENLQAHVVIVSLCDAAHA